VGWGRKIVVKMQIAKNILGFMENNVGRNSVGIIL
jgi:hypothetical protein